MIDNIQIPMNPLPTSFSTVPAYHIPSINFIITVLQLFGNISHYITKYLNTQYRICYLKSSIKVFLERDPLLKNGQQAYNASNIRKNHST